ncbi:MAG TPA: class I SAM-dependent methyltransferase [Gemmatimonadaceae bacterium]|nr:class I SAM-dependent methyltransferase [Gemmatimonadaceae bacterium]
MTDTGPSDPAGAETLDIMAAAPRYNEWQYRQIERFIGSRVLEVGAGIGNMSQHIVTGDREIVVLTDPDEAYRSLLRERFSGMDSVIVEPLRLPDSAAVRHLMAMRLDTAVALNVVEHVEDDVGALRQLGEVVGPRGHIVVLVPALPSIYGSLDEELGHFRRYTRQSLSNAFGDAGLDVVHMAWFNRVGIVGWWMNARIRRQRRIPLSQLRLFDALVPLLRYEKVLPMPFGQSLIAVGRARLKG